MIKTLLCIILFLILGIICKKNNTYQYFIHEKIYQESLSFYYFKEFYNKYLGGVFPIENLDNQDIIQVFNDSLVYDDMVEYLNGVKLNVGLNYLIPNQKKGIVVYVGKKDGYQNVVMIEDDDGVVTWYGNICNSLVHIYDQVDFGDYLGEACSEEIYLVYTKGNEFLDYRKYLN